MNYYERIQNSIDYIEDNLEAKIEIIDVAKVAYMSMSVLYRMFFSIVGFTVKEYIRNRRFNKASLELLNTDKTILDIAINYDYESADAFSRAFQNVSGYLPSEFRQNKEHYIFKRIDIMDKYFEISDKDLLEKYPNIKVLKELSPMNVAYYNFHGENPEKEAFSVMFEWINSLHNSYGMEKYRIFGYNNPSPKAPNWDDYGYEVCVTIDDNTDINHPKINTKTLQGGLYVTIHVKAKEREIGYDVMEAWESINSWIKDSKYDFCDHQYFEEYLSFEANMENIKEIEIYVPIKKK